MIETPNAGEKFVNETISISFEYPSNWKAGTGIEVYYHISPKVEAFPSGEYPWGTLFNLFYGKPPFDNLEVLTRVWVADVVDRSDEYSDYEITPETYNSLIDWIKFRVEYDLRKLGWKRSIASSIDSDEAYNFIFNLIQTKNGIKQIEKSIIGK